MGDDKAHIEDRLLEYFKTCDNSALIVNLYLSYMSAIEFIMIHEMDGEYNRFCKIKERQAQNQKNAMEKYLDHLKENTDWNDTDN